MNKKAMIETEDKKAKKIFALIMIGAGIVGMLVGISAALIEEVSLPMDEIFERMRNLMVYVIPVLAVLLNIVIFSICFIWLKKIDQLYQNWDGEDEEADRIMDQGLDRVNATSTIFMIVIMFLYGAEFFFFNRGEFSVTNLILFAVTSIVFMIGLFGGVTILKKSVNYAKLLNPEKRGSIYDLNFTKKWEDSSDEREMFTRYKAGYQAYKTTQITCMILWVLFLFMEGAFKTGLLPMLITTVLWLVCTISYIAAANKLEKIY